MKHAHSGLRRSVSSIATLALLAGATAVLAAATPVQAATTTITNAELRWELNQESTGGAFAPGTWNLFSAGKLDDPSAGGQTLTSADQGATWINGRSAGWTSSAGNVTIEDKQDDGSYAPTTWQGTRTNAAGLTTNTGSILSENVISIAGGTGTVDPDTDTGTLSWDGDFTVVYYSGMSFFYVSDPQLTVADGTGTVTATLSGYGSDMDDPTAWNALPETEVTLADVTGVDLTPSGLSITPDYLGVTVSPPAGNSPQVTSNAATAGSFPQSFVDFQGSVGTASYWYSSGGSVDARKVTTPLSVTWAPTVRVSRTTLLPHGAQQVTVEGTGFDPALATGTRPPLAGKPGGAYIAFGRYADVWRPSAGAPSAARVNAGGAALNWAVSSADMMTVGGPAAGAVELRPDGSFTATLTIDKAVVDAKTSTGNYGIYTYPGSGGVEASYETYTPITFAKAAPGVAISAAPVTYGAHVPVTVTVTGDSSPTGSVTLTDGATTVGTADLVGGKASFALNRPAARAHALSASYAGDVNTDAGTAAGTVTVAKVVPTVAVVAADVQSGGPVTATVTVPSAATGTVVLKEAGTVLGTSSVISGTATFTLTGLPSGAHALVASYAGDANHEAASGTARVTVGPAAPSTEPATEPATGKATVGWATKPSAGTRGTARIAVSKSATGKVTVVLKNARGKKIRTVRVKIKKGVATVKLPRLTKGKYTLVVKVPGNDDVTRARVTRTFRVR